MPTYRAYGLALLADAPVPGLLAAGDVEKPDVRIRLNSLPSWLEPGGRIRYRRADGDGTPALIVWELPREGWFRLEYRDGTEFVVSPQEGEVWARWPAASTVEDTATYLVGPVMGFLLRMRGVCCLHASAVNIGGEAIAFLGPPRAGKSTTAAAFAKLGYPVVSDDILALAEEDGRFVVRPGYPRLCLWPDSAASLYGSLPRITPEDGASEWWDKRYLNLAAGERRFESRSLPLAAIFLLEERMDAGDRPRVEPVPAPAALVKLAFNTYMNYLLDRDLRSREFAFLGRLVGGLPVRRAIPHSDPARLPRLCEAILQCSTSTITAP